MCCIVVLDSEDCSEDTEPRDWSLVGMALRVGELLLLADDIRGGIPMFSGMDCIESSRVSIIIPSRYLSGRPSLSSVVRPVFALPTLPVLLFLGRDPSPF